MYRKSLDHTVLKKKNQKMSIGNTRSLRPAKYKAGAVRQVQPDISYATVIKDKYNKRYLQHNHDDLLVISATVTKLNAPC